MQFVWLSLIYRDICHDSLINCCLRANQYEFPSLKNYKSKFVDRHVTVVTKISCTDYFRVIQTQSEQALSHVSGASSNTFKTPGLKDRSPPHNKLIAFPMYLQT